MEDFSGFYKFHNWALRIQRYSRASAMFLMKFSDFYIQGKHILWTKNLVSILPYFLCFHDDIYILTLNAVTLWLELKMDGKKRVFFHLAMIKALTDTMSIILLSTIGIVSVTALILGHWKKTSVLRSFFQLSHTIGASSVKIVRL